MQIFNTQPDDLARACAGDRQRIGQQPELMIQHISGGDKFVHLIVGKNNVARLLSIRQIGKADFPGVPVLDALIVQRGQGQRGAQTATKPIDSGRCHRAEQAVAPLFQLGSREQCHRLGQQGAGEVYARMLGVVGICIARDQIAPYRPSAPRQL